MFFWCVWWWWWWWWAVSKKTKKLGVVKSFVFTHPKGDYYLGRRQVLLTLAARTITYIAAAIITHIYGGDYYLHNVA